MSAQPDDAPQKRLLTALFPDSDSAETAFRKCMERGLAVDNVNVVISEGTRTRLLRTEQAIKEELASRKTEGGELGGPSGGRAGILVTIFAAVGAAVAIPATGFIAGPIAVALTAAGAAGVAAGLITALSDWGIPEERVKHYEAAIRKGGILMTVHVPTDAEARQLAAEWQEAGGKDVVYG
jgi:hypothetical protein